MAVIIDKNIIEALQNAVTDAIFWGGVFAFVAASVNAIKAGIRGVKNAKLANTQQAAEGSQPCSKIGECFIAGTLVETEDGLKPIEEIEVGDKVLAYDEETGEQAYKEVVRLFRNQTKEWYHVFVHGEEIVCTGGHPFYVVGKGFIPAKELKAEDILLQSDGTQTQIYAINIENLEEPETTYNFEVADFHTYYVTDNKVLVHNDCKPTSPVKVEDSYIRKNKIDAHALKKEVLGNKSKDIAKFDIFRDTANNNRIWLGNKSQTIWHDTGYYFDDLISLFGGG